MAIKLNKKTVTKNRTEEEQRRLQEKAYPKDNLNSVMKSREARQAQQQQETDRVNQIMADVQRKKKERETQQAYDRITAAARSRVPGTDWMRSYAPPDLRAQGNFKGGITSVYQQSSGKIYSAAQDALRIRSERDRQRAQISGGTAYNPEDKTVGNYVQGDNKDNDSGIFTSGHIRPEDDQEGYEEYKKQMARYNEMKGWKKKQQYYKGQEEEAQKELDKINSSLGVDFAPEGETPYRVKDRTNHYYQDPQYKEQIDEKFYDSIVGAGEYKKRKAAFTNDAAGWEQADQLELDMTQAWEAYENGQPEEAYRILTGKDDAAKYRKDLEAAQRASKVAEEKLKGYQDVENAPYLELGMTEGQYLRELQNNLDRGAYDPATAEYVKNYIYYSQMPDAANSRAYSEYMGQGIENGMFDNTGDLSLMSTGKIQTNLADLKRRKAQAAANSRNWDEYNEELRGTQDTRMTYNSLAEYGVQDKDVTGTNLKAKPDAREMFNRYPERFLNPDNAEEYFDGLLYDQVHGEGSFKNIIQNGTDEEYDRAQAEVDDLWQRIENGTVSELATAGSARMNELASEVYGGKSKQEASRLDKQIKASQDELTRRQTISRYNDLEGAEYDPSLVNDPVAYQSYMETGEGLKGNDDFLYWVINTINGTENEYGSGFIGELREVQEAENDYRKYAFMTPEMVGKYNRLYRENRKDEARAFLNAIDPYISQLASGRAQEIREQASKGNYGGLYGAATVLRQPFAGVSGSIAVLAALMGNEDAGNPNSGWYKWQRMTNTTRGARAESWGNFFAEKFGEQYRGAGEWLNGVTYSMADNIMAMALTKGAGVAFGFDKASKAATGVMQFIMSSSASASKMVEKLDSGMDPTEAAIYALGDGIIEAITEKYSIEALLHANIKEMLGKPAQILKYIGKNTLAESTEEGASNILGTTFDELMSKVFGHESELEAEYNALISQGMGEKEASRQVWNNWRDTLLSEMLAGGVSGFFLSGGNVALNTVSQHQAGEKIRNKSNTTAGKTGVEQLIEAAKGMDADTESRRLAEELNEKVQSGKKVSSGEAGRLAQNILYETNETMGNIARDTVERMVRDTMKENGATPDQIERTAGIVTDAVVKNKKLTKGEMATVAEVRQAIEAYRHLMTNEGKLEAGMTVRMNPEGDVTRSVRETVGRLLNGESAEKVDHRISRDIMQGVQSMVLANDEDLANVQNGKRTKTGMDAIVDNEIVQVTGKEGDSYIVKTADGTEKKVSAAAVTAVDTMAGAIMAYTEGNGRSVLGDEAFGTIAKGAEQNKKMAPAKYIAEAMKVYMAARTGGQMPGTTLAERTANDIWTAAQEENRQATQDRQAAGQLKVEAGKGTASFDGAEYGTDAWKEKIRGMSKQIRNQMGAVAEYAKRIGLHVDFINDPENEAIFGSEDRSTGRITINVAGREADLKVGGKTVLGENHHLLVVAAHEFTHWLEQNSTESYDELRQFIFDKIRSRGQSVEALVMNKIDAYRSVAKQDLSVEDAMAEIVADACDQVLGSEKVAREIEQSNPNLFSKIKSFVTNLVARIREAAAGMSTSASAEARLLQGWADELEDRWLKTLEEAQGRKKETQNKEKTASAKQLSIRNISEQDQAYADAVERGDIQAATDMLMDKLAESENIIPFNAPNWYAGEHADVAQLIKTGTPEAIARAAASMASYVPDNGVLVPMPNHHGQVNNDTDTMILAKAIGELTSRPVIAALEGADRESRYTSKAAGGKGIQAEEMGFRQVKEIPEGTVPIFVDNVVGSGVTAQAAREAMGGGITLAYAKSVRSKGIEGLKRATITYDRNGELIPLSQRFNPNVRNINYSVRQMDQEYMEAVNSGDMEKAQLMVDQAAKEAGYTLKVYHGTPSGGFNTFRDWSYFTENKGYAERYQSPSASSIRSIREGEGNRQVYELYMNPGKVFDTRKAKERKLFNEARLEYGLTSLDNMSRGLPDWTDGRDIIEYIEENGLDYDTVILDEGADGGYGEEVRDRGISYVTKANMVKSAAPVVYDDAGNVIPLSERFNPEQRDIRYSVRQLNDAYMRAARTGDSETMDALVKEAAERAGFDTSRVAYHGTMSFGFTEFDMDDMQSEIFVSYNPELAASYTENDEFKQIHEGEKRPNLKKMKAEDLADYLMEVVRKTGDKSITGIEYLGEDNEGGQQFKTSYILESTGSKKESIITRENVYRMINRRFVTSGVYSLYTRPGKRLVIDAHGSDWNEVVVFDTNQPIDIAGYFNIKDSYGDDVFTTRQIAEFARSKGYDSVEIKNVYDDGMMNDNLDRGRKGKLKGDIAIFFNPNDVKSADTITYDDAGSIIPPSERFSDDSNDLRFSIRQGDMEINRWMEGLTASSLQTEQERTMLKQWKNTRGSLDLARHALFGYKTELSKLEAKPNPTAYEKHQMIVLRDRIEAWQKKVDRYETSLAKATSEKGFAAIMRKQSRIMNDLVNGRTADEVRGTVDAINAELETVQKEMEARKERLKQLAAKEAVIRIRQQLNSAGLKRIAAKLKSDLNSELSNTEIENRLALMALKMKEGNIDEEDVTELADMLIGKMRRTYDSYILDELRGRTITLSQSQQKELKGQNRTIREIRQELAGTGIRIDTKGGNTLDKNWSELCDLIPALNREAADKDMLDQLLNVIAAEKEAARNQYTANMDMEVASMVIDAASNLVPEIVTDKKSMQLIRETLNFIAEMSTEAEESARAMEELNSLMTRLQKKGREAKATLGTMESNIQDAIAYNNELSLQSEQANWLNERHKLIDQLKSEHTQEMLRQQAEFRLRIEKDKTARGLMNENMALRRRIHTNISRIRNLLMKESVKQNIPEHMKGLAREMLDRIVRNDMSGRKITGMDLKMLQETRRVLDAWEKQDGKYNPEQLKGLDEAVQDAVYNALEDIKAGIDFYNASTRGSELQVNLQAFKNALTRISDGVSTITGIINAERSIALGDRRVAVEDQAYKVQESAGDKRAKELTGSLGRTIAALRKAVTSGNLTPEYFFKMLKNAGLNDLWEEYHRAENRNGLELAKSKAKLDEIAQKYGYKSWDTDARQEVKLASGSVNMTLGQIMSLYATWKREHTLGPAVSQHLQNGGFYVEEYDPRKGILGRRVVDLKAHRVTEADMEMVNSLLTDEQKKFVDDIVAYMSTDMSELGNEASMKAYGIKMYKESYYFPFKMWDGIRARASNDSGSAAAANDRAFHPSFSKTRLHGANNALMLGDFMTTAADHIVGMINYATMGLANENLQKVLNAQVPEGERLDQMTRRTIRTVLEEAYGRTMTEYLAKLQEQLNGGVGRVDRTVYDRMLTLFRKNAVAGSMSVALQQPLSYIRAAMMINPKYMTEALAREYWQGSYQERMKHSGISVIKDMGRFDMGFGQGAREYITPDGKEGKIRKVWDAVTDKATIPPELMDRWTWNRLWVAVKAEQHDLHPDMDVKSDAFLDIVAERFNDIVRKTQVYDSTLTKSQNMRSQNPFVKSITSFMAEPTLSLNVLADAVQNAKEKGGKLKLAKALATFALSAMAQAAAKALMSTGRSPDEKKTWKENYLYRYYANLISEADPMNLIPGYNDLITLLKNGKLEDDAMGVLGKLFTAGDKLAGMFKAGAGYREIEDGAGQIIQLLTQLPAKNIMRDLRAMYNWFIGKPYADRETSAAVIRLQAEASLMTADNLLGVIMAKLGEAGYKVTNSAYYDRMYSAYQRGDQQGAEAIREYLTLGKGVDESQIDSNMRTMTRKDNLFPALEANKAAEIAAAIKDLQEFGAEVKDIKSAITKEMKPKYLAADHAGKIKIRDAIQKAYRAMGLTAVDADKVINGWKDE